MDAAGLAPVVIAVTAFGIIVARNFPAAQVLSARGDLQELRGFGIDGGEAGAHALGIELLEGAILAVGRHTARIVGVGCVDRREDAGELC